MTRCGPGRLAVALAVLPLLAGCHGAGRAAGRPVKARVGTLRSTVQASGSVAPLNKVEILPPVAGRMDRIKIPEGAFVRKGDILAWMSSSERAVLLDNAQAKGREEVAYWEREYAPTPIIAPVDGLIIARNVVEGQTVSQATVLYEMSDRLIVQAAVDETDLGKIRANQRAEVTVDAYPDRPFAATVALISHQATKVNNVVSYEVNLEPRKVPGILRAGMTANVDFIVEERAGVLLLPAWAVKGAEQTTVKLNVSSGEPGARPKPRDVELGASDGAQVEVRSGLQEGEAVIVESLRLGSAAGANPFMGQRPAGQRGGGGGGGGGARGGR